MRRKISETTRRFPGTMAALSLLLVGVGVVPGAYAADDPPTPPTLPPPTLPNVLDEEPAGEAEGEPAPRTESESETETATETDPTLPEDQPAPADPEAPAAGEIAPPLEVELAPAPLPEPEPGLEAVPSDTSKEDPAASATEPTAPAPRARPIGAPEASASDLPEAKPAEKIPHKGAILEFKSGVLGCVGALCADPSGHNAGVGLALDGFLGGNIRGFLDIGVEGGWGRLNPQNIAGRSLTDVYGFDIDALSMMIGDPLVAQAAVSALTLTEASMSVVHGGPALRLHVIPRGRVSAYVGTGAHYQQWRTRYTTTSSEHVGLTFHGTSFPLVAGLGFYPHRHLALGIEGRYVPSLYWIAAIQSPFLSSPVPISALDRLGPVSDRLPSFWTMNATARVRF